MTSTAPPGAAHGLLLPDHPNRIELNDEVHARPPEALEPPLRISFLALLAPDGARPDEWRHIGALAERYDVPPPAQGANHFSVDLGPYRVKWERHTEYTRYKFIVPGVKGDDPFALPALSAVPADWLEDLQGEVLVATHVTLLRDDDALTDIDRLSERLFAGNPLIGSRIAGGAATALTDFRIHGDGFGRLLVLDRGMTQRQAGRMVQRLLEIDVYRMLALLALPVAGELAPFLSTCERELAAVTTALTDASPADEPELLDRLTRLQAGIESRHADNNYRFAAAAAYDGLVQWRIAELREERLPGLQNFRQFMERRLTPAMNTCRAVAARQDSLSVRMARATQLLSTRVEVDRQLQNQAVLESMNRRARLQLRLQETVEGLSIAAVTYYLVSLVGYAAKGVSAAGVPVKTDLAIGISIPVVAFLVALGVRRIRKMVTRGTTF